MLFAVQPLRRSQQTLPIYWHADVPVRNVPLMHELEALVQRSSKLFGDDTTRGETHLTNLREEIHKLAECLEPRVLKGAQKWHDHQLLAGVGYLDNVEQGYTMVTGISGDLRG